MNFRLFYFWMVAILVGANVASAQFDYDFFWSDRNLSEGAINQDLVIDVEVGDVVPLYLYWSTNGPANSDLRTACAVDVSTSKSGIIRFDSAESIEFELLLLGKFSIQKYRWGGSQGTGGFAGPAQEVTPDFINRIFAFTITGDGIRESNNGSGTFLDSGYDAQTDAFLFGELSFTALESGQVQLTTVTHQTGCVNGPNTIDVAHSLVTVNVTGGFLLGDVNLDGVVNLLDVSPFVQVLTSQDYQAEADINLDGAVDLLDVPLFGDLLSQ